MSKKKITIRAVLYLLLLAFIFYAAYAGTHSVSHEKPVLQQGYANLFGFNLEERLAVLPASSFVYYPNLLYTPENVPESLFSGSGKQASGKEWKGYGTYRMVLELPAGETYGINSYSALYSQRLFVNGKELSSMGVPGTSVDTTIPETGYYTVFFTPETDLTEILIQAASFHYGGGGLYDLLLGTEENINIRSHTVKSRIYLAEGGLIASFLLSAGLYLFFNRRTNLWFSMACVAVFIRIAAVEENNLFHFLSLLSWEDMIGLKGLSTIMLGFFFVLYIKDFFPKVFYRTSVTAFGVGCLLTTVMVIFTSTAFYTRVIFLVLWGSWLFLAYSAIVVTIYIIRTRKALSVEQVLSFAEFQLFTICFFGDLYLYRSGSYNMSIGLMDLGTVICININTIVPIIDYALTTTERDKARIAEQKIRETNLWLDRLNCIRAEFLQNLSHELRTPLTVIGNCAGLTALQIQRNLLDEDTLVNMSIIKREAVRLGNMVEQIKEISVERSWGLTLTETDICSLLQRTANFCEPICRKNENVIDIRVEELISAPVNVDSIFQVLLNLIINANRHVKQGTIILKAEKLPAGEICISVIDHGEGIPSHLMPHIYKRHVSGDGGSGLGLPICKEIMEQHGGTVEIQSIPGRGTVVHLILPAEKKEPITDADSARLP